jgi:mannitol/fructose-specific phosphotransferase system IIA component (Ntr-type)
MGLAQSIQSVLVLEAASATNRDQAIRVIVEQVAADGRFHPSLTDELCTQLIVRDELGPTGIGEGVAIPHVWHPGLSSIITALAISPSGLNYPSLDGEPVHIIVLILSPPGATEEPAKQRHFETWLRHLRNPSFRAALRLATTEEHIWETVCAQDRYMDESVRV